MKTSVRQAEPCRRRHAADAFPLGLFGASLLALCWASPAAAQTASPATSQAPTPEVQHSDAQKEMIERNRVLENQEVTERKQPGYAPIGLKLGAFNLNPGLDVGVGYTDNLYSTDTNTKSDFYTTINPSLYVQSDWTVHQLEFWASGTMLRYLEYTGENSENFDVFARGKLDIVRNSWIALKPSYGLYTETRGSPDAVTGGLEPVKVTTKGLELTGEHKTSRLWFAGDASYRKVSHTDSILADGTNVNNADRDRTEIAGGVKVGYEIIPGYSAFVEGRANDRKYDSTVDDLGYRRDSSGYETRLGAEIELTGKLKGNAYLGYLWQEYNDARFDQLGAPVFGAGLTWNATGLTTVKLIAARTIEETTIGRAAGNLQNAVELKVDHELQRNIILSAGAKYMQQEFRGVGRTFDVYEGKLKGTYQINRMYKLSAGYTYTNRSADTAASEYSTNVFLLGFGALF